MRGYVTTGAKLFPSIFSTEGSGVYRLIPFKKENSKTLFMVTKVLSHKLIMVKIVSCIKGAEEALHNSWNNLETESTNLSLYHLENGDIRVMKG